jgi:NADPH:quinone reductase
MVSAGLGSRDGTALDRDAVGGLDVFMFEEYEVHPPQQGEVNIEVRAAGMNPDATHVARGDAADFSKAIGYEISGVASAVGS